LKKARARWARIESTNTRRRNSENDGQILLGGGSIGYCTEPKQTWVLSRGWKNARRLSQSMRETNDEAVHTIGIQRMKENGLPHRSPTLGAAGLLPLMTYVKKRKAVNFHLVSLDSHRKCKAFDWTMPLTSVHLLILISVPVQSMTSVVHRYLEICLLGCTAVFIFLLI
jgi:hypothetical protein